MAEPPLPPYNPPRSDRSNPFRKIIIHIQRTLGAGILVMLPIGVTILILKFLFDLLDGILKEPLGLLPGPEIPGIGLAVLIVSVYLVGIIAAQVVGRRLIAFGHRVLEVIPLVKNIYGTTRSAVELLSNNNESRYSGVVLIDWPRPGIQSIGLVTSRMVDTDGKEVLAVYIPTTPIPSSGFLVIVSASEVTRTDMSVEEAMRVVISGGIHLDTVFQRAGFQVPGRTRSNQ